MEWRERMVKAIALSNKVVARDRTKAVAFKIALFSVLTACVVFWIVRLVQNIGQPQLEYSEGLMMENAIKFQTGQWSWSWGELPPYLVSFYPPVYYLILGHLFDWFGTSLIVGRTFGLITFIACLMLCYLIIWQVTQGKKWMALIGALFPLTQLILSGWSFLMKVDIPAMMFELAGVYIALKFQKSKWLFASIPLFLLAFYTKQSAVAGAIAVFIYLLFQDKKLAFKWGSVCLVSLLAIFGAANLATHGEFYKQIVLYQQTVPFLRPFKEVFSQWFMCYLVLLPIMCMSFIFIEKNYRHLIGVFALVAMAINTLTVMRIGSGQNYMFEVMFGMCLAAGCALPRVFEIHRIQDFAPFVVTICLLIANPMVVGFPDPGYASRVQDVKAIIRDAQYPILTENFSLVVEEGKEPYMDAFVFYQFNKLGYWNQQTVINDLESRKIEYVITVTPIPETLQRLDESIQDAVKDNYTCVYNQGNYGNYGLVVYKAKVSENY